MVLINALRKRLNEVKHPFWEKATCKKINCYSCKTNKISNCGPPESFEILNIPGENGSKETIWVFKKALTMFGNLKRFLFM